MGEKVYRPKTKEGHHLVRSKENPDCVRGVSFDEKEILKKCLTNRKKCDMLDKLLQAAIDTTNRELKKL